MTATPQESIDTFLSKALNDAFKPVAKRVFDFEPAKAGELNPDVRLDIHSASAVLYDLKMLP